MGIDERFKGHEARDAKLRGAAARVAENQKVGWPIKAATAVVGVLTIALLAYVALQACTPLGALKTYSCDATALSELTDQPVNTWFEKWQVE
jgi:hypothetical protein